MDRDSAWVRRRRGRAGRLREAEPRRSAPGDPTHSSRHERMAPLAVDVTERLFERKADAEAWDARARSGIAPEVHVDRRERNLTFREYSERWRLSRESGWAIGTRRRVESNLRCQLYRVFGDWSLRSITLTSVLEWVTACLADDMPQASLTLHFELLDAVLGAAVIDKAAPDNRCDGVRLSKVLRGASRAPKWVPDKDEGRKVAPRRPTTPRRSTLAWCGSGAPPRGGAGPQGRHPVPRSSARRTLHVVQQMQYSVTAFWRPLLDRAEGWVIGDDRPGPTGRPARRRSRPSVSSDRGRPGRRHIRSSGRRTVPLLFTTTHRNPINDKTWSREWSKWRQAAGWPTKHGTFHALRHFFATTLITNNAEPPERSTAAAAQDAAYHARNVRGLVAQA